MKHSAGYMPVLKVFGFSMPACRFISPPATFDALDGFDERIRAKEETYTERKELDEGEKEELNRKLCYLHTLTMNGRLARQNRPTVAITYFSPCTDIENDWYGCGGQYKTISGTVLRVEMDAILIKTNNKVMALGLESDLDQCGDRHRNRAGNLYSFQSWKIKSLVAFDKGKVQVMSSP